ncbi:hypothetical protein B0A52_08092 [Exophiala mesophila]|uniref:PRISE-like Rossmann-fold domain-containing protein n=1 Tax=Exophiala mesophila TaxID=212818 RepID=A0A438N007_EXOME|nr:hypothetical protein B0A52_08092 [Exophiala mesophila]
MISKSEACKGGAPVHYQTVYSREIYHGLPTFDESHNGQTAIITGANGISGYAQLQVLAQSPQRWTKIYCLSRRPPAVPGGLPPQAEFIQCDFLKSPEEIGEVLKKSGVKADHIFFFAYIQPPPKEGGGIWSAADELTTVNKLLLDNFLGALDFANIKPKRFMLQTGAKNYGGHLGPTKVPQQESDPRVLLEPNFYYAQEDSLWDWCRQRSISWNIAMPSYIVGAVPDAAMNIAFPLAVYALVSKYLSEPLRYTGDIVSWQMTQTQSNAFMNAYLEEWMVLTPKAANQKFNALDDSAFSWEGLWPKIAECYDLEWEGPDEDAEYTEVPVLYGAPRGYGNNCLLARYKFTTAEWAHQPKVCSAWREIARQHNTDKARKLGFHGYVNTAESFLHTFEGLAQLRMIPPVPKTKVEYTAL